MNRSSEERSVYQAELKDAAIARLSAPLLAGRSHQSGSGHRRSGSNGWLVGNTAATRRNRTERVGSTPTDAYSCVDAMTARAYFARERALQPPNSTTSVAGTEFIWFRAAPVGPWRAVPLDSKLPVDERRHPRFGLVAQVAPLNTLPPSRATHMFDPSD